MRSEGTVRLGLVGCGEHSQVYAAAAREIGHATIVCACDVDATKAHDWVARNGGEASYGSLEAMLSHADLDGVILCTWPNQHAEQIRVCLSNGVRNVLCEKALVTSAAEAKAVRAIVEQGGANLVEASMYRHHPAIRKLERILASGDVGTVDSVRAAFHNFEPEDDGPKGIGSSWRTRAECGGGVPYDWMHYLVDACNHFTGSVPRRVFASGNTSDRGRVIYRIYGMIEYENGCIGIIECSKTANFSNALQITCSHGILHLPIAWAIQGEVAIKLTRRKPDWGFILEDTYQIGKVNAYALELEDFCRVVRDSAAPCVPLGDSLMNAVTTEALVTSLRQKRSVELESIEP